jgi:hypothetical protein
MTCNTYIPSSTKNVNFGFLSKYKVEKWSVNGKSLLSLKVGPLGINP